MRYTSYTSQGKHRNKNKDKIKIIDRESYILFLVFDGVSTSKNAALAINCYLDFILKNEIVYLNSSKPRLSDLLAHANSHLIESDINNGHSTLVAVLIDKNNHSNNKYISLGDTRIYLISPQSLKQITVDDNPLDTPNIITKYIGMVEFNSNDFIEKKLPNFDRLIICTDGFYNLLGNNLATYHRILNFKRLGDTKRVLSEKISDNNIDDASYVIVENYVPNRERSSQ